MLWQFLHLFYILSSIKATTNTQGHGLKGALHYEPTLGKEISWFCMVDPNAGRGTGLRWRIDCREMG